MTPTPTPTTTPITPSQIQVSARHKIVAVPTRTDLENLFPSAKRLTYEGKDMILVPHGPAETRMLRNLGMNVPSPIITQYDWEGGTPYDVQKRTAELLTTHQRAYVLNGMGTGKTKSALWAWRYLHRQGLAGKVLVVAPLSTLNFTWAREVFSTLPGVNVQVLHGSKEKRLQRLSDPEADVFVINHDGLAVILDEILNRKDIDTLILDELAVYRNGTAIRTKKARLLAKEMTWVWGMTGSPTPNEPTDAWGQASVVTPATTPKYFTRFRDQVMQKVTQFKFVPKPDALEQVQSLLQPAVRFTLEDVVELPDMVERTLDVALGKQQKHVYDKMAAEAHVAVQAGDITAMNAAVVLGKLLQISAGWVYTSDGSVVALDNDDRLDALVDAINSSDRKVIVFVPYVHALEGVAKRLTHEGIDVRTVSGDTPKGKRDEIFNLFQNTSGVRVIAAHPQCMSHGLTLTAADTIIWFSPTTSLEIFEQANARIRRIGQKAKQQILMFQATKAERGMYARLRAKQKVQNELLDLIADATTTTP